MKTHTETKNDCLKQHLENVKEQEKYSLKAWKEEMKNKTQELSEIAIEYQAEDENMKLRAELSELYKQREELKKQETINGFEEFYNRKRQKERRDMFAAAALQGAIAAGYDDRYNNDWVIQHVIELVDHLLVELDSTEEK